ncbi:putative leucine-rich repeat-containing, plant-type, leucine-rich repeat domain, L [Medicago truncatula]|nr:receptor-like protein EIX1 [Medicago truncatula]RHN58975.1 putative leucine-rich repeat-containing, plant-type, leucine-rich repeat domain, L [Medicago truncatula]
MVNTNFLQLIAKFIAILCLLMHGHVLCNGGLNSQFIASEAEALLEFKEGLKDPSNLLSSWKHGKDCCQWKGVGCNTTTGHVISLNLHCSNSLDKLQGHLNSSLLQLPYLSYLNLSGNDFMQSTVPDFLSTTKNLKHLDLSHANFKGNLLDNLGNLSLLESLDLSDNSFYVNNLKWLHGLSSLKILDLSGVVLSRCQNDWFHDIRVILHSLDTLRLSGCQLHKLPTSPPPEMNFDSLVTLDLSGNNFNMTIPDWLFENCHHLQNLNLSNNNLQGQISYSIERVTTLAILDLSKNSLNGLIPNFFDKLVNLVALDLSYNMLSGSIPSTLGQDHGQNSLKELRLSINQLNGSLERSIYQLSNLVVLNLAVNNMEGIISDVHLANFSNLKVLDLSFNHVTLNMSKNWVPPFQLETIGLANCHLGPQFPKWIQTQKNFSHIDISNAGVSDYVPNWFWDLSPNVEYMNLSSNELRRCGQDFSQKFKLKTLDLSNNSFSCPLPRLPPNLRNLDLSSNLFYGTISHVCEILCFNNSLENLDLSFNNLSGVIPNCWTNGTNMIILNLAMNNFIGSIPDSFGSLKNLHMLIMYNNNLSGKIPETLKNCQVLTLLNLKSNRLRGPIPYWIGTDIQILMVLILGNNSFDENIPKTLCQLKSLHILDLSENQLTGAIPRCVFLALTTEESINEKSYMEFMTIEESLPIYLSRTKHPLLIPWKGVNVFFNEGRLFFEILKMIDLSSNFLTHEIPVEIGKLVELSALNLSRNQLLGSIPSSIGELESLNVLDLSRNNLSCEIPTSMANIDRLSWLDLSYNALSGKIPIGNQMQSFDEVFYKGNPHLCGPPLRKACPRNSSFEDTHCSHSEEHENDGNHGDKVLGMEINPLYISMAMGFSTGFWVFWGSLILIASWRHAYFRFISNMNDKIHVTVVVALNKLRRKFHTQQPPM